MTLSVIKPRLFVSRCLGFDACRWNGAEIPDAFIEKLKPCTEIIHACPEADIGLGVPRNPVRLVRQDDSDRMVQLDTERDVTDDMQRFSDNLIGSLEYADGFILKGRSPSCGLKDVKVYPGLDRHNTVAKTAGLFAREVIKTFPGIPVETEGRLKNFTIRETFLTRLFVLARFRQTAAEHFIKNLVRFHAEHKLLLMAYNQKEMRIMGRITANHERKAQEQVFSEYAEHLKKALEKPARYTSNINVLMHAFGYVSEKLSGEEKRFFLNTLEEYRREQMPLSVPRHLMHAHAVRFGEEYLLQQVFFSPYPADLTEITDSGKGRNG